MKSKLTLVTALAILSLAAAGCGGDGSSADNAEDTEAITALITEINRVTSEKDAQGFCAVMQPSGVAETYNTQARCVEETAEILKQSAGDEPVLVIQDISIDGDEATVDLENNAGGAPVKLVKEGGKWYVPFSTSEIEPDAETTDSGTTSE